MSGGVGFRTALTERLNIVKPTLQQVSDSRGHSTNLVFFVGHVKGNIKVNELTVLFSKCCVYAKFTK